MKKELQEEMSENKKVSLTVLLPAGRLPLEIMSEAYRLASEYNLRIYLSTLQNLRLTDVAEKNIEDIKAALSAAGADFKGAGKFPLPRVCIGKDHCNLGIVDTEALSDQILERFSYKAHTKAKIKIAVAGCTMCCSNIKTTDIGVMATRNGYEVFAGGKGGPFPKVGRRVGKKLVADQVLDIIENVVTFHDNKTEKKQRMSKLISDPDFPYPEV